MMLLFFKSRTHVNTIEQLRKRVIDKQMSLATMQNVWPVWQPEIRKLITSSYIPTHIELKNIGNNLSNIFKSTSNGRTQSSVSAGGTAWEALVCWYLNLCLIGSRTVIVRASKSLVPTPISDCITVMYGSVSSNTESDLLAITFPQVCFENNNDFRTDKNLKSYFDEELTANFTNTELTVIQCKTNWNDNAQIPMLWDLIYRSVGFGNAATVGINGFINTALAKFSYAFVTVPTVDSSKIKPNSTAVLRVRALSGGNYWGMATNNSIALNVFELITKNFQTSLASYPHSWPADIRGEIENMVNNENYFNL
jgi:hypothetical protein